MGDTTAETAQIITVQIMETTEDITSPATEITQTTSFRIVAVTAATTSLETTPAAIVRARVTAAITNHPMEGMAEPIVRLRIAAMGSLAVLATGLAKLSSDRLVGSKSRRTRSS